MPGCGSLTRRESLRLSIELGCKFCKGKFIRERFWLTVSGDGIPALSSSEVYPYVNILVGDTEFRALFFLARLAVSFPPLSSNIFLAVCWKTLRSRLLFAGLHQTLLCLYFSSAPISLKYHGCGAFFTVILENCYRWHFLFIHEKLRLLRKENNGTVKKRQVTQVAL